MERERVAMLHLYGSAGFNLRSRSVIQKFEKERSERDSLAASSGYCLDLAWGTWQHPTHI
jgi:hypothetical protein